MVLVQKTELNGPLSYEPPLESTLHLKQIILLLTCLELLWQDRNDFFAAGNLSIYYQPEQVKQKKFRGPDFFVVLNTERKDRNSWAVWEEDDKYPNLIVEIISKKTASVDKGFKKELYQDTFKTSEYFWFEPKKLEFMGFRLRDGKYVEITANEQGWRWSQELGLYLGVTNNKLRYFTAEGMVVPTPEEEAARQRQRAERLAEQLRSMGIAPDTIDI